MPISIKTNQAIKGYLDKQVQRIKSLGQAGHRIGNYWARGARRNAPRDRGRLAKSLTYAITPNGNGLRIAIVSDVAYAKIQQYGGDIHGGSPNSKIAGNKPRYLAIPLNDAAKKLYASLGASQSLRSIPRESVNLCVIRHGDNLLLIDVGRAADSRISGLRQRHAKRMITLEKRKRRLVDRRDAGARLQQEIMTDRLIRGERDQYAAQRVKVEAQRAYRDATKAMFLLKESAHMNPNPPGGYVPSVRDGEMRDMIAREIRRLLD
jgi:hypothetical protein